MSIPIASIFRRLSARPASVEAYLWTALDELQKGNPIAWREAGVNARPRFGLALR
jgi:hypothetical protein